MIEKPKIKTPVVNTNIEELQAKRKKDLILLAVLGAGGSAALIGGLIGMTLSSAAIAKGVSIGIAVAGIITITIAAVKLNQFYNSRPQIEKEKSDSGKIESPALTK